MTGATVRRNRVYAARMAPEQRRDQLLDGVLRVIVDQGVHKVSIDAVAREVGVTRPVVYGLFADSSDLLRGSLEREERGALVQIGRALRRAKDSEPDRRVTVAIREFLEAVLEAPDRWRAILMLVDSSTPAFRKTLEQGMQVLVEELEALVRSTVGDRSGVDVEMSARALQAYMSDAAKLLLAESDRFPIDRLVAFGARTFTAR